MRGKRVDRIDLAAARKALGQRGRVAWDKVKADLSLKDKKRVSRRIK